MPPSVTSVTRPAGRRRGPAERYVPGDHECSERKANDDARESPGQPNSRADDDRRDQADGKPYRRILHVGEHDMTLACPTSVRTISARDRHTDDARPPHLRARSTHLTDVLEKRTASRDQARRPLTTSLAVSWWHERVGTRWRSGAAQRGCAARTLEGSPGRPSVGPRGRSCREGAREALLVEVLV